MLCLLALRSDTSQLNGFQLDTEVKTSAGFVFGRRLTTSTPAVVCDCMAYISAGIRAEGLFRIPGDKGNVEKIQASYDKSETDALNRLEYIDIHDVCSTLESYFNLMPEPLIPYETYNQLEKHFHSEAEAAGVLNNKQIIEIVQTIEGPQLGLLGLLLNFLHDIAKEKQ